MIRVIGGEHRGRMLRTPPGPGTRPATGRVRESVFSTLGMRVREAHVLDLYAGSGSFGIEALSRGGRSAVFVERSRPALESLRSNLKSLGITDEARVVAARVERYLLDDLPGPWFDIVFADPPWDISSGELAGILARVSSRMNPGAVAVVTRRAGDDTPMVHGLKIADQRRHGDAEIIRYLKE